MKSGRTTWLTVGLMLMVSSAWAINSPTDITGLVLWLDAAQGVTQSGGNVSAWADQSSQGNNFTQSTAARQPTLVANAFNGRPAISFNKTGVVAPDEPDFLSTSSLQLNTTMTAFFVMKPELLPADTSQRFAGHYANGQFRFNSGKASMYVGANADLTSPLPVLDQFQTIAYRLNGNVQISIDDSTFVTTRTSASITASSLCVGGVNNAGVYDGDIAEIIIYDAVLSDAQATEVFAYIAAKYAEPAAPEVNNGDGALTGFGCATLRGNLTTGNVADVTIYWGRENGGVSTNYENRLVLPGTPQGAFETTIDVGYGYPEYYYICFASNSVGTDWAPASTNFSMPAPTLPLAGMELWLDAGAITGLNDGDNVALWEDQSDKGVDVSKGSRAGGTFKTGIVNGRPVVRFAAGGGLDSGPGGLSGIPADGDRTIFMVLNPAAGFGDSEAFGTANTEMLDFGTYSANNRIRIRGGGFDVYSPANSVMYGSWHAIAVDADASGTRAHSDGANIVNTATKASHYSLATTFGVGWAQYSGREYRGDMAELLVYNRLLSSDEQDWVGSYLAQKYAIDTEYPDLAGLSITNTAVSALDPDSATLNGYLDAANWSFDVYVYYGTNNGETVAGDWETNAFVGTFHGYTGAIEYAASDLDEVSQYYYAFFATNAVTNLWAQPSEGFQTVGNVMASNGVASPVTQTNVTLGATLAAGGGGELRIYWGLSNEGTDADAWDYTNSFGEVLQGTHTTNLPVLAGAPYYFRVYATNAIGEDWADETAEFTTPVPAVSLAAVPAAPATFAEKGGTATVTATLSAPSVSNITANFSFDGGAVKDTDYSSSADSVTIAAGTLSSNITLTAIDDAAQDEDKTVAVSLDSLVHATNGSPAIANLLIQSDDPKVANTGGATLVTENGARLNGVLTMGDSATIKVFWGDADHGMDAPAWAVTNNLGVKNEDLAFFTDIGGLLANKTYHYRCYATNDSLLAEDWADSTVSFNTGEPSVSIDDVAVTEGDGGTVDAVFTITISTLSAIPVSVTATAASGTATAGQDFLATNAVVTIPAGQPSATFTVRVKGDTQFEYPDEVFHVNLSGESDCTIADAQGTGTIGGDDDAVALIQVDLERNLDIANQSQETQAGWDSQKIAAAAGDNELVAVKNVGTVLLLR